MACAKTWLYSPGTKDGVPINVRKRALVKWQIAVTPPFKAIAEAMFSCITSTDEGRDEFKRASLHTVVSVHFSKGQTTQVKVLASSGTPDLDQRVVACHMQMSPELTNWIEGDKDEVFVAYAPPP